MALVLPTEKARDLPVQKTAVPGRRSFLEVRKPVPVLSFPTCFPEKRTFRTMSSRY